MTGGSQKDDEWTNRILRLGRVSLFTETEIWLDVSFRTPGMEKEKQTLPTGESLVVCRNKLQRLIRKDCSRLRTYHTYFVVPVFFVLSFPMGGARHDNEIVDVDGMDK